MTRGAIAALGLAAAAVLAGSGVAAAADGQVQLPQPIVGLSTTPPLTSATRPVVELRIPGPLSSEERVRVDVDERGKPTGVSATQRLLLRGPGDYIFAIPAPVEDVLPASGTDSQPGFRRGAILWQGFSPGERVLAARARLEVGPAAEALPLDVTLSSRVGGSTLEPGERRSGDAEISLEVGNRTAISTQSFTGRGDVRELAETLDATVKSLRERVPLPAGVVTVHGPTAQARYRVDVEFRIEGTLLFPAGRLDVTSIAGGHAVHVGGRTAVRFAGSVGGDGPKRLRIRLKGDAAGLGAPRLSLEAIPVLRVGGLVPPRGRTWVRAVREGLVEVDGRTLMGTAVRAYLRLARTNQYLNYLLNPDVGAGLVRNRAVYLYASAPVRAAVEPAGGDGSGLGAFGLAALLAGLVLAAATAVVVWAHS